MENVYVIRMFIFTSIFMFVFNLTSDYIRPRLYTPQHRLPSCKLNVYDHDIRIPGEFYSQRCACDPDSPSRTWVVPPQRPFAGLRLYDRDSRGLDQCLKRVSRASVNHTTTCHNERPLGILDAGHCPREQLCIGPWARNQCDPRLEEFLGIVPRLSLHILWQAQGHCTGLS